MGAQTTIETIEIEGAAVYRRLRIERRFLDQKRGRRLRELMLEQSSITHRARFSEQGRWFPVTRMGRVLAVRHGGRAVSYAPRGRAVELKAID